MLKNQLIIKVQNSCRIYILLFIKFGLTFTISYSKNKIIEIYSIWVPS
jgi:hypothetical protein